MNDRLCSYGQNYAPSTGFSAKQRILYPVHFFAIRETENSRGEVYLEAVSPMKAGLIYDGVTVCLYGIGRDVGRIVEQKAVERCHI